MAVPFDDDDDSPTIEQEDDEWVVVVKIEIHDFAVLIESQIIKVYFKPIVDWMMEIY